MESVDIENTSHQGKQLTDDPSHKPLGFSVLVKMMNMPPVQSIEIKSQRATGRDFDQQFDKQLDLKLDEHLRSKQSKVKSIDPSIDPSINPSNHSDIKWRHSGWMHRRRNLLASLQRTNQLSRFDRVSNCGTHAFVFRNDETGEIRVRASHCHDKLCVPCSIARGLIISENLKAKLSDKTSSTFQHIVLTKKHSDDSLSNQIDRIQNEFNKLRRSKFWSDNVQGGYATTEVTRSKSGQWHVHLHIIAEANGSINKSDLSNAWLSITTDSSVVDVSKIDGTGKAGHIISKYLSKPINPGTFQNDEALDEFLTATAGRRSITTFGSWRGLKLSERNTDPISELSWTFLGSLERVLARGLYDRKWSFIRKQLEEHRIVLSRPPPPHVEAF